MSEPEWILEITAYAIHAGQIVEHGGVDGIRDQGLLESALDHPKNLYHYHKDESIDIFSLAAAYGYHMANNHPFFDGNKRTAYVVSRTFLITNGYDISVNEEEKVSVFIKVAEKYISEHDLACWYRRNGYRV